MIEKHEIFDLCRRAEIGLNFLNNNVDKKRGCLPYFFTFFENDPAEATMIVQSGNRGILLTKKQNPAQISIFFVDHRFTLFLKPTNASKSIWLLIWHNGLQILSYFTAIIFLKMDSGIARPVRDGTRPLMAIPIADLQQLQGLQLSALLLKTSPS